MATPFSKEDILDDKDKPQVPKEFEGKSAADLMAMIATERAEKEQIKAAAAAQEGRLTELSGKIDRLTPPPKPVDSKGADWFSQPKEAADALFDAKIRPLAEAYLNNEEVRQIEAVSKMKYFDKYKDEITTLIKRGSPDVKVQPGFGRGVYDFVIGKHLDEVLAAEKKEAEEVAARMPEFTETRSAGGSRREIKATASPEEIAVAEAQGVPIEKYLAWRDNPKETSIAVLTAKRA